MWAKSKKEGYLYSAILVCHDDDVPYPVGA